MHWFFDHASTDSSRAKAEPHYLEYCSFDHMWPLLTPQNATSCVFSTPDYITSQQMRLKMPKQQPENINWTIRFSLVAIACIIIIAAVNLPYIIWRKRAKKNAPDQYWIMIILIYNLALLDALLIISVLSCGLVTGLILNFAIVVKPGLAKLTDTSA